MNMTVSSKEEIRNDIAKAYEELSEDKNVDKNATTPKEIENKDDDDFVDDTDDSTGTKIESPIAEKEEDAEEKLEAPVSWKKEDKEVFAKLPADAQKIIVRRNKEMEGDYTRKNSEFAPIKNVVDQFSDTIKSYGWKPEQAVGVALNTMNVLKHGTPQQKAKEVKDIIEGYGVDLSMLGLGTAQHDPMEDLDPNLRKIMEENRRLQEELSGLSQKVVTKDDLEIRARQQEVFNELTHMSQARDAKNNLKYPYMEEVADQMLELAHFNRVNGHTSNLIELYEKAVRLNPAAFDKLMGSQRQALQTNQQKTVDKAKKAAVSVAGAPSGISVASKKGLNYHSNNRREDISKDLENAFAEYAGQI